MNQFRNFLVGLLTAGVLAGQSPDFPLRLVKGDKWITVSRQDFRMPDSKEIEEGFTYKSETTILEKSEAGWRAESKTELIASRAGETVLPPPIGAMPLVEKFLIGPNGEQGTFVGQIADPIEFRMSRLTWFIGPKRATSGEQQDSAEWTLSFPGDEGGAVPEAAVQFHVVRAGEFESRKAHWVDVQLKEQKSSAAILSRATFVVDDQTGVVLHVDVDAKNVPLPGGTEQRYDLSIERKTQLNLNPKRN